MKLDELLQLAADVVKRSTNETKEFVLAYELIGLLAEVAPCGHAEPEARPGGLVDVPTEWGVEYVSAEDARHMARMLLRAADEAESK